MLVFLLFFWNIGIGSFFPFPRIAWQHWCTRCRGVAFLMWYLWCCDVGNVAFVMLCLWWRDVVMLNLWRCVCDAVMLYCCCVCDVVFLTLWRYVCDVVLMTLWHCVCSRWWRRQRVLLSRLRSLRGWRRWAQTLRRWLWYCAGVTLT